MNETVTRNAGNEYLTQAVLTASPEKLVCLLYDGALKSLDRAAAAFESGRRSEAGEAVGRALGIVGELRATLDFDAGGEIAQRLFALYGFVVDRITQGNLKRNADFIREARLVISKLKEGWDALAGAA